MPSDPRIQITINPPEPPPIDPCVAGNHPWAWVYLTRGGIAQCCRRCGTPRR